MKVNNFLNKTRFLALLLPLVALSYTISAANAESCATANENNNLTLTCPTGQVITEVDFASYGTPGGSCGSFTTSSCDASNSVSVVNDACKGKNSCSLKADNKTFGDPCNGTVKNLSAQVTCAIASETNTEPTPAPAPIPGRCNGPVIGMQGSNPIAPHIFTADPAVLVHDCTFYITAGHDEGSNGFLLRDWYLLSSNDMVNWSDNGGPVLSLDLFSWADANAWAGQMVERNGKFYWYVPVNERGGGMAIGVAVGDSPVGPFRDAIGGPLINDTIEMRQFNYSEASQTVFTIDPTVFVDDNNQAYLSYGGFWRMVTVELGDDMITLKGDMVERTPQDFFEAPYLSKRNDTYYMVYAAGSNPATIDYATSNSPMGPWQYQGRILDALQGLPGEDAPTSHPAIAEFAGLWYLVYHLSNGPGGGTYRRQVAIDKLEFNADGTTTRAITQVID